MWSNSELHRDMSDQFIDLGSNSISGNLNCGGSEKHGLVLFTQEMQIARRQKSFHGWKSKLHARTSHFTVEKVKCARPNVIYSVK